MNHISLYDKYHSEHNKTYMYNLITNLIKKEKLIDVSSNPTYNQFYETNFKQTFMKLTTEDLSVLNKHLLDTQIEYYNNFISKNEDVIKDKVDKEEDGHIIIHSIGRIINLKDSNRFLYKINHTLESRQCQIEKIIVPIEDKFLFANPILIVSFENVSIELHLRGTMKLGHREYGLYTPFYESTFHLNSGKIQISFKNQLLQTYKKCDVYKIESNEDNFLHISNSKNDFLVGDYIRLCNFENVQMDDDSCLNEQYKITEVKDNGLRIENIDNIKQGLYIMNVSLQHTIHLSYH